MARLQLSVACLCAHWISYLVATQKKYILQCVQKRDCNNKDEPSEGRFKKYTENEYERKKLLKSREKVVSLSLLSTARLVFFAYTKHESRSTREEGMKTFFTPTTILRPVFLESANYRLLPFKISHVRIGVCVCAKFFGRTRTFLYLSASIFSRSIIFTFYNFASPVLFSQMFRVVFHRCYLSL